MSASGSALWASIFLSRIEEFIEEDSFNFFPVQNISEYPDPHKMLSRLLRANFSVSTAFLALWDYSAGLVEVTVLDIPPSS